MAKEQDLQAYSRDGRLFQIEYAMNASNLGTTTIAITSSTSTILVSEKKIISKMQNLKNLGKHCKIYDKIAISYSGISSDAKAIIKKAREYCLQHEKLYSEHPILEGLLGYLSTLALKFGEKEYKNKIFSRPFGVNIVFAGYENEKPVLYLFDPSGTYRRFMAKGIGGAAEAVEQELKEMFKPGMSDEEAVELGLNLIKKVMKDSITNNNVEVCMVGNDGVRFISEEEIQNFIPKLK